MTKTSDYEDGVPMTHTGGLGQSFPPGEGTPLKPPTPKSSNVHELTSELKVLKLQENIVKLTKKLKNKNMKVQEVLLLPQMKKEMTPPPTKAPEPRKAMEKRRMCLSLLITQPLSIMIACLLTIPSHPCTPASRPILMGRTMPNSIMD
jgi:hypothetical protein